MKILQHCTRRICKNVCGTLIALLVALIIFKRVCSGSTVDVTVNNYQAVETTPLAVSAYFTSNVVDKGHTNTSFLMNQVNKTNTSQRHLPVRNHKVEGKTATLDRNETAATEKPTLNYKNSRPSSRIKVSVTLAPNSHNNNQENLRFGSDYQLPKKNLTEIALNESDYLEMLFNLSQIAIDDEIDSLTVIKKHLKLNKCLIYRIESEKLERAKFDLWRIYLILRNIWFPSEFEKYLIRAIDSFTKWNHKNWTLEAYKIENGLRIAKAEVLIMKLILEITNVTVMRKVHKALTVSKRFLNDRLINSLEIKSYISGIQQGLYSQQPPYHKENFYSEFAYFLAVKKYLSSYISFLNFHDICYAVLASLIF